MCLLFVCFTIAIRIPEDNVVYAELGHLSDYSAVEKALYVRYVRK